MSLELFWHKYRYFPYEKELANRELKALVEFDRIVPSDDGINLRNVKDSSAAKNLTYFDSFVNGHGREQTLQGKIEAEARVGARRQATRYSVHGLHEYKGKFNPQVARALLNIFGVGVGKNVLDPFCGSGTTLVEASRLGARAFGTDLNPLAVLIANAKVQALRTDVSELQKCCHRIESGFQKSSKLSEQEDERSTYLKKWFDPGVLEIIENLRDVIEAEGQELAPVFQVIASNLLREYSQQDPRDLRIRRRTSPIPTKSFQHAFFERCEATLAQIAAAQNVIGTLDTRSIAVARDNTSLKVEEFEEPFDCAVTSPPYATALPYIDTQRLSLVWLGLTAPKEIVPLESDLIGSRELRGSARGFFDDAMSLNSAELPDEQAAYCLKLRAALTESDGFRRRAMPALLYRYFASMRDSMLSTLNVLRPGSKYALIVGHNHTTLGGHRFDIDTPNHLAKIAVSVGWNLDELIPLQTYQRYDGYHVGNAVAAETLIVLEK